MRNTLLLSASVSALLMGSSLVAQAADPALPASVDTYVSIFGGYNIARAHMAYTTSQFSYDLKDGFTVGAAYGRNIGNGFRAESELSYVANELSSLTNDATDPPTLTSGHARSLFLLGNIWKDFRLTDTVQPYIGVGLGTAYLNFEDVDAKNVSDTGLAFAGQVGAGVRVALSDKLALDASYRLRAAMDASLEGFDDFDNAVASHFSHTAQLGVTYALGDGQVMSSSASDPSDWYVSLFAGGVQTRSIYNYDDGYAYLIDHKHGFTVGGAAGTHLAPGLRAELELSYLHSALKNYSYEGGPTDVATGDLNQAFLLFNLWKDFDVGMLTPYVGGGFGVGSLRFDDAEVQHDISGKRGYGFAGQFGLGARMAVADNVSVDLGYRFKSIFDVLIENDTPGPYNSDGTTTNHVVQLGLNYGLGAGGDNAGLPDTRYVSLFGGFVLPVDAHASYNSGDYLVSFKTGYSVGAAVGVNVTENLRTELEASMQSYDVDKVYDQGVLNSDFGGSVNGYFLMANLWRDMDIGGFKLYGGGGVGLGFMDVNIVYCCGDDGVDSFDAAFVGQVGSGIRYDVTDNMTVDLGYRFKAAMAVGTEGLVGDDHNISSYFTQTGQLGVTWKF
jgi:opacity protein-like surface antigen